MIESGSSLNDLVWPTQRFYLSEKEPHWAGSPWFAQRYGSLINIPLPGTRHTDLHLILDRGLTRRCIGQLRQLLGLTSGHDPWRSRNLQWARDKLDVAIFVFNTFMKIPKKYRTVSTSSRFFQFPQYQNNNDSINQRRNTIIQLH